MQGCHEIQELQGKEKLHHAVKIKRGDNVLSAIPTVIDTNDRPFFKLHFKNSKVNKNA